MLNRVPRWAPPAVIVALLLTALGLAVFGQDDGPPKPDSDAPPLSPAHEGAQGAYGMFTEVGGRAVTLVVDRARTALDRGARRDEVLARVRQDMRKLFEQEETGEVGDTDVCEQVAAALSEALVAHGQQEIEACDEILEEPDG